MMDIEPNDEYHVTMHNINLNINPWGGKKETLSDEDDDDGCPERNAIIKNISPL